MKKRIKSGNTSKRIKSHTPLIPLELEEYKLCFDFSSLCECRNSEKILNKDIKYNKKLLKALFEITKFFKGKRQHTLDIKGETTPKDYKKLEGKGIKGYSHKFKLDGKVSVLANEQPIENRLVICIGEVGDQH